MLEILSHFRKKRIFGPISSQNMRVIKRFVKTCLFHLEMKENNTSYFVTCHPLSSLQSISMAYGQTATFLFSHYEFSKTLETSILCYKLIFKSRAPITGPSYQNNLSLQCCDNLLFLKRISVVCCVGCET